MAGSERPPPTGSLTRQTLAEGWKVFPDVKMSLIKVAGKCDKPDKVIVRDQTWSSAKPDPP